MYKITLFIVLLFVTSCGTTGHMVFYDFDVNKYDVEREILNVINKDSSHVLPKKWEDCSKGDMFERIYVYFKSRPEEIYQIGFADDKTVWMNSSASRLAMISQFDGDTWRYESDLSNKKIKRIVNRFETEILSKVKYQYTKSN